MTTRHFHLMVTAAILVASLAGCSLRPQPTPSESTKNDLGAAKANIDLAIDYMQSGNPDDAKVKLLRAMSEAPNYAPTWYTMAYYEEATHHFKKANQDYQEAIALAPNTGGPYNNYGTFLCRHGKYKQAINQFVTAANVPDYTHSAAAYENAGLCAMMVPDKLAAKGFFLQAINNNPLRKTALLELAKIYYGEGNTAESKAYFKKYAKITQTPQSQYKKLMSFKQVSRRLS